MAHEIYTFETDGSTRIFSTLVKAVKAAVDGLQHNYGDFFAIAVLNKNLEGEYVVTNRLSVDMQIFCTPSRIKDLEMILRHLLYGFQDEAFKTAKQAVEDIYEYEMTR